MTCTPNPCRLIGSLKKKLPRARTLQLKALNVKEPTDTVAPLIKLVNPDPKNGAFLTEERSRHAHTSTHTRTSGLGELLEA